MPSTFSVEIHGLDELRRRLRPTHLHGPLRRFFERSTKAIEAAAKPLVPVDTGRLRASIASEIDPSPLPGWGRVGTNVSYGVFVHEGTRPHFPPPAALGRWASRHGFGPEGGFLVARAISRRGTRARPFLRLGAQAALGRIRSFVTVLATEIEAGFRG